MKFENARMLVVSPDFPYPPHHGGLVDIWRRLKILRALGLEVDLVATVKQEPSREDLDCVRRYVNCIYLAERTSHLKSILSIGPAQLALRHSLRSVQLVGVYDYALLETEFVGSMLDNPCFNCRKTILRVQNNEAQYLRAAAATESSFHKRLYYLVESLKWHHYSQVLAKRADMLWFISMVEYKQFTSYFDAEKDMTEKAYVLPAPVEKTEMHARSSSNNQVLFLGNLFTPVNRDAVRWYVEEVHPKLADIPGYRLVVAGSTQGKSTEWLRQLASTFANIDLHFDVLDPGYLYESSSVFINPMLAGAGVKLKTINAIEAGLPVVTTPVGSEGTGFQDGIHVLIGSDPLSFASNVRLLLLHRDIASRIVAASQRLLSEKYDHSALIREYLLKLGEVGNKTTVTIGNEG